MDEATPSSSSGSSFMKYIIPVAVLALIVVVAVFFFTQNDTQTQSLSQETVQQSSSETETQEETISQYTDGTYSSTGEYVSPGGPRTIDLTVTVENGIITDSTFVDNASDPTSQRFQGEFGDNYQPMIIGKNIDEVALTKVAGSSLTPQGFTDALEKIKAEAQS